MEFNYNFYNEVVKDFKYSVKRKEDERLEHFYNTVSFQEILKIIKEVALKGENKVCIAYFLNRSDFKDKMLTSDILKKMGFEVKYSMEKSSGVFGYFTVSWNDYIYTRGE